MTTDQVIPEPPEYLDASLPDDPERDRLYEALAHSRGYDDPLELEHAIAAREGLPLELGEVERWAWTHFVRSAWTTHGGDPADHVEHATRAIALDRIHNTIVNAKAFYPEEHPIRERIEAMRREVFDLVDVYWRALGADACHELEERMRRELGTEDDPQTP